MRVLNMTNWYIPNLDSDQYDALDYANPKDHNVMSYFWGYETQYDPEYPGGFKSAREPSFPETWEPILVEKCRAKKADILSLIGYMAITEHALACLKPILGEAVLLPILCGEEILYVVGAEQIDCLNYEQSIFDQYPNGEIDDIEAFSLFYEKLEEKHIFRLPRIFIPTLVSQTFKDTVEKNKLMGIKFEQITEIE
jgi:hypothetical protein